MKIFFKRTGYVVLPLIILFLAVLLNRETVSYFILENVTQYYAGKSGIVLNIDNFSGNLFSETKLVKINVRTAKASSQTYSFEADTITCTYNLWDLQEGYKLFLEGLSCSLYTPELRYDFRTTEMQASPPEKPGHYLLPGVLPKLDVHNGNVILTGAEWNAEIREINSILQPADDGHALQVKSNKFIFKKNDKNRIETGFTSTLRYTDTKIILDSFEIGEQEISVAGVIDLAQVENGHTGFAADLIFAESRLDFTGSIENGILKTHSSTKDFDIGELQKRLGATDLDISGIIEGEADLVYNIKSGNDLNGSYNFRMQDVQLKKVGIDSIFLSGRFDDKGFNISSAEARTPENHILINDVSIPVPLLLTGDVLSIIGGSKAKFKVDITDFTSFLPFVNTEEDAFTEMISPLSLIISGYLEKEAIYLDKLKATTSESSLVINRATIPLPTTVEPFESIPVNFAARFESSNIQEWAELFGDTPLSGKLILDLRIEGSVKNPRAAVSLSGDQFRLNDLQLGSLSLQGELKAHQEKVGKLESLDFTITELSQKNNSGTLALALPATATWQPDKFSIDSDFRLDDESKVAFEIEKKTELGIAGKVMAQNLGSKGWLGNFIKGRYFFHDANIETIFSGLPSNPQIHINGSVNEAGDTEISLPLSGTFSLKYSSNGIEISEFTWKSQEQSQITMAGNLPYDPMADEPFLDGDLSLQGSVDLPSLKDIEFILKPWGIGKGSVILDMDISGSWDQPEGYILLKANNIEPPDKLQHYVDSSLNLTCNIVAEGDSIVLKSANIESKAYSAQATGSWKHNISTKRLLQSRKAELKGEVFADATVQLKDLNFLRDRISWLRRLEGDMQGELHMSGPITDPAITGSFSLLDGEISHTFNFPMLSTVNLHGEFDERSITIKNMLAEVGGSPVNLKGRVNKENNSVAANLHVEGNNVLLFRNNDMRMRGDVQLDISGPLERLIVKGTTALTGGYYTGNIDFLSKVGSSSAPVSEGKSFLFSFPDPPLKNAALDIKITTNEPFRIRNNLIRGLLRPELSLNGTGELPFLIGTIYIDPSRVLLPSGRLQIQSGLLRFLAGKPDRPELDIIANSKILGYDINVVTSGPLDDPIITLSSSPVLPHDDLLLLLLTGQPPKEDIAGGAQSRATTNVMVYLGRNFLSNWLEDESGTNDETILERFELDYGRDITKSGEQTVEGTFRLSDQTIGKRRVYYLSGEKDKYDAYNYGLKLVFRFE